MAEWLRRWTANPLGSARAGSNPAGVVSGLSTAQPPHFIEFQILILLSMI